MAVVAQVGIGETARSGGRDHGRFQEEKVEAEEAGACERGAEESTQEVPEEVDEADDEAIVGQERVREETREEGPGTKGTCSEAPGEGPPQDATDARPTSSCGAVAGPASAVKGVAEKVRDCDASTGIWFITAGSVEHAAIQKRGIDGAVVIRTDAGVTDVVPVGNLFETADEARAARYR
jgi:hypothetical protein